MENNRNFRTFEEVFNSTFHNRVSFDDFVNGSINTEYSIVKFKNKSIYSPSLNLKKIQRFLNKSILEYALTNERVVFSYRKGASVRDAVEVHSKSKYFFQTDIKNFFGQIKKDVVENIIGTQLGCVPIIDIEEYHDVLLRYLIVDGHVPIGFSTSPIISNLSLFYFDNDLEEYCLKNDFKYTRYADDIIISSTDYEIDLHKTKSLIKSFLLRNNFVGELINDKKTRIQVRNGVIKLLGFNILLDGTVTIPSKDKKEVEIMLNFYLNDKSKFDDYVSKLKTRSGRLNEGKSLRENGISSLSGRIIGINAMDKKYIGKLKSKYGNAVIEMFLRKTVK
ncbi:reverse transcriptase family protein [Shewanella algae]|uniref:reverse transcriptase family protein n=1 Tax=Shewanella algae TaxID=38313 RepID=UPI0011830FBD|nr:reverse transcriptase family protein [Shewanella algae]